MLVWRSLSSGPSLPLVSRLAIGLLSLCGALLLAGDAEAASCGLYVKRLGPGFVPGKAAAERVAAHSAAMPASAPCGCHGPECQRAPLRHLPASPTPPERIASSQELTTTASAMLHLSLGSSWLAGDSFSRPVRGYPLETNRPPCV